VIGRENRFQIAAVALIVVVVFAFGLAIWAVTDSFDDTVTFQIEMGDRVRMTLPCEPVLHGGGSKSGWTADRHPLREPCERPAFVRRWLAIGSVGTAVVIAIGTMGTSVGRPRSASVE
jgi:hypothetical protein